MCNLFKESLHKVTAQEIFANERPDVHYHLRQMDTQEFGEPSPALHISSGHLVSSMLSTSRVKTPVAGKLKSIAALVRNRPWEPVLADNEAGKPMAARPVARTKTSSFPPQVLQSGSRSDVGRCCVYPSEG